MSDFDLIVLGGGSGGLAAAFRAAQHGARVAMLEPHLLGGTCVNVGCVPKKAMWLAADIAGKLALAGALGFPMQPGSLDWPTFIAHRQRYIENIHASYRRRLAAAGIATLPMRAHFVDAQTVECADGVRLNSPKILIATGGRPQRPQIPGAELGGVSDDFFHLCDAPKRVALIGAGYIAVELAGVLQALGSAVEMFVRGQRLLNGFDTELTDMLAEDYRQSGVHIHFNHPLQSLERDGTQLRLRDASGNSSAPFDTVLFATGRQPNTDGLGLEQVGIATDLRGHVLVDAWQATNIEGVYAVGDVTGQLALTPVAIAAARRLMDRLFGGLRDAKLDYRDVPTVVFAHPPIATVGLTEADARAEHGDAVQVFRTNFRPMLNSLADVPQRSLFKLVCVGDERRVIGIHLLGDGADEIMQGFAVAMKRGITLDDLHDTVAIHPTSAEEVVLMR